MTLTSQEPVYVIGHLNPDTDAICAAIGYAEYLRVAEGTNAEALRCGSVPSRVKWVLDQAGVRAPKLVTDIRTTAELISDKATVMVSEGDTFLKVYNAMQQSGVESLPVVSDDGEIRGILNFTQLMQLLMPQDVSGSKAVKTVYVSPQKILESLKGVSVGAPIAGEEEELVMFVGASSEVTTRAGLIRDLDLGISKMQLVICGDRTRLQQVAIENQVRMMVVTGGFDVEPEMLKLAHENGVMIICCEYDTATTVQLIRCSKMVDTAMGSEFFCVDNDEAVSDIRKRLSLAQQEIFPVVKKGTKDLIGVFTKADLVAPPETKVVMVDHNEYSQAVKGIEEAKVVEVIDHHRLGGNVVSREPIRFLNEPVGSSSTLIARKFKDRNAPLSKGVALCLSAGLISDTLNLTSPTTTDVDRDILKWLCEIAGVDAAQFTNDLFASGSLLIMGSVDELLNTDRKEFEEGGKSISITQVEEIGLDAFDGRRVEIEEGLESLIKHKGYDVAIAAITDVTKHISLILAKGDERIIREIAFEHRPDGVIYAKDVVSRKKQIFPAVCDAIHSATAKLIE
ncbi:MAG: putative manganese-dependent inorganic diphosphatase [Akkermansiaceae bacterium]